MPGRKKKFHVQPPLAGLDRRGAYRKESPYGTPDARNVRPFATIEGRERVGSRPGLTLSHRGRLSANPVRMLESIDISFTDGFSSETDTFSGTALASAWTTASWIGTAPGVLSSMLSYVDTTITNGAVVRDAISIDNTQAYTVEMYIAPYAGAHHGKYSIFARMDNTTPVATTAGIVAEITMIDAVGTYTGNLTVYVAGSPTVYAFTGGADGAALAGWFTVHIAADTVTVYWAGTQVVTQAISASAGERTGFGMECTQSGGICYCDAFRVQYYQDTDAPAIRSFLVGSGGGDLYRETFSGVMEAVSSSLTVSSTNRLFGAQSGQELVIADYGLHVKGTDGVVSGSSLDATSVPDWTTKGIDKDDDVVVITNGTGATTNETYTISSVASGNLTLSSAPGDGTCSFRVERGMKVYDPVANTITLITASAGQVPTGNPVIARYNDRILVAGGDIAPNGWYASKKGTYDGWDFSEGNADSAILGSASDTGVPGKPIVAIFTHSDDYLIFLCIGETRILRGDPGYSPSMDVLSQTVGAVTAGSWCFGPTGEIVFLSRDGIYMIAPGANSYPVQVSRERLPEELVNVSDTANVCMEYDVRDRGVHIYLTPSSSNEKIHWWFDWVNKGFWPMLLSADHQPTSIVRHVSSSVEDTAVILGCSDGYLRRYSKYSDNDQGTAISSYVVYGPMRLGDDFIDGKLMELFAVLAENSGDVTWEVVAANSYEGIIAALNGTINDTGTWDEGVNYAIRPEYTRGMSWALKLTGTGSRWAVERIAGTKRMLGRQKLL